MNDREDSKSLRRVSIMKVSAVLFDLDDTLLVEEASVKEAFLAVCEHARAKYGIDPTELSQTVRTTARTLWQASPMIGYCRKIGVSSWEGLWARFHGDDGNLKALREWAPTYRRDAWSQALTTHGIEDNAFAEHLSEQFQSERRSRQVLFPRTETTLEKLCGRYRLGLITNGLSDLQREKIEGANLSRYFGTIVVSGEVGFAKPDPPIFQLALKELKVSADEALMVGNSLRKDIVGAKHAGLRSVWINRFGNAPGDEVSPDFIIESLGELEQVLRAGE